MLSVKILRCAMAIVALSLPACSEAQSFPDPAASGTRGSADVLLVAALRSKIPSEAMPLSADPYLAMQSGSPPLAPGTAVCGVSFATDRIHYRLATFANPAAAKTAGYAVTHYGVCGTCSTLQDLAVYLEKPDLTTPVRKCGIKWSSASRLDCLKELGFSTPCAQTWLYNIENTRRHCFTVCAWSWIEGEAPTQEDGKLNHCLQCDEDRSGPVFKATAGRTRRNSGIHSSIPRPDDEIAPMIHNYLPEPISR